MRIGACGTPMRGVLAVLSAPNRARHPRSRRPRRDNEGVSSPSRPAGVRSGAPRTGATERPPAGPGLRASAARPSGAASSSARSSTASDAPRIEAAPPRGSWTAAMSAKAIVLACILALAAALVVPSLRVYLDQQRELAQLRAERDAAREEVEDLTAELARWDDPAFVVAQARERLAYVFPGETPYRVIDPEFVTASAPDSAAGMAETDPNAGAPWYDSLWGSVVTVGEGPDVDVRPSVPAPSDEEVRQLTTVDFGG